MCCRADGGACWFVDVPGWEWIVAMLADPMLQFLVYGTPVSGQTKTASQRASRRLWKDKIIQNAREQGCVPPVPFSSELSVMIVFFHLSNTSLDVDNISSPYWTPCRSISMRTTGLSAKSSCAEHRCPSECLF